MGSWRLFVDRVQDERDSAGQTLPFRSFGHELFTPQRSEAIKSGPLALVRERPRGGYPASGLETMKSGIQRAGLDLKQFFRGALNVLGNRMTVSGAGKSGAEDE